MGKETVTFFIQKKAVAGALFGKASAHFPDFSFNIHVLPHARIPVGSARMNLSSRVSISHDGSHAVKEIFLMGAYYAKNLAELEFLILERPDESPSVFLPDDGLAAFYYDRYTLRDLKRFFEGDPDLGLCADFGVSAGQWRESVMMALFAKKVMKRRQEQ